MFTRHPRGGYLYGVMCHTTRSRILPGADKCVVSACTVSQTRRSGTKNGHRGGKNFARALKNVVGIFPCSSSLVAENSASTDTEDGYRRTCLKTHSHQEFLTAIFLTISIKACLYRAPQCRGGFHFLDFLFFGNSRTTKGTFF